MVIVEVKKILDTVIKSNEKNGGKYKDFWKILACCLVCIGGFSQGVMFCWNIPYISQTKDGNHNATKPHQLGTPYPINNMTRMNSYGILNSTKIELTKDTESSLKQDGEQYPAACKKSISWISSSPNLGSVFGALLSGPLLLLFNPHRLIPMLSLATSISWFLVTHNPDSAIWISIGKGLVGLFVSLQATYAPQYITRTAPSKYASTLSCVLVVARNLGQVLTASSTFYLGWVQMTYMYGLAPPLIIAILFFLLPKTSQSLESIKNKPTDKIDIAVIISEDLKEEKKENINVIKKMSYLLFLGSSMCLSGMVPITSYVSYLLDLPSSLDNVYSYSDTTASLAFLICGFLGSIISTIIALRVGRRSVLLITSLFLAMSTTSLSVYYFLLPTYELSAFFYYVPLITFNVLMFTFFIGIGTLFSVILGDILPQSGQTFTYPTIFGWLNVLNFVQNYCFPHIVCQFQFMGIGMSFLFYTFINIVSFICIYFYGE